jgi:hypothetical protein
LEYWSWQVAKFLVFVNLVLEFLMVLLLVLLVTAAAEAVVVVVTMRRWATQSRNKNGEKAA